MSWSRLGDEAGRMQVGLQFMLNVAQIDTGCFKVSGSAQRTPASRIVVLLFQVESERGFFRQRFDQVGEN